MSKGERVPLPFAWRWFLPGICRTDNQWRLWTYTGIVLQATAIGWYCDDWRAALLLGGLPALWRFSVRHPVLVDAVPFGLAIFVGALWRHSGHDTLAILSVIVLSIQAGAMKEQAPVFAALFAWSPWPLIGLIGILPGAIFRARVANKTDNPWIREPIVSAFRARRHNWLNWTFTLAPWGLLLPIAAVYGDWRMWLTFAIAHVPWLCTSDWNRISGWSAPVLIAAALQWDTSLWPLILLLHVSNPYRGA